MKPEDFYRPEDHPDQRQRRRMWHQVDSAIRGTEPLFAVRDLRSFTYGMAASIVLLLSVYGLYRFVEQAAAADRPVELRFDAAYRSAIEEFERLLPTAIEAREAAPTQDATEAQLQQIRLIDAAIRELRADAGRGDLSSLTQSRLRQLYGLKLKVLLEIIEQGESRS